MASGERSRREVVNGALIESPQPDLRARELADTVRDVLLRFATESGLGTVYGSPVTVKLSEHDLVEPTLAFVRQSRGHLMRGGVVEGIPDLIVEVKTDSRSDDALGAKTNRFRDLGVPEFWLIYEVHGQLGFHVQGWEFGKWVLFARDPVIRSMALPGLELRIADVAGD